MTLQLLQLIKRKKNNLKMTICCMSISPQSLSWGLYEWAKALLINYIKGLDAGEKIPYVGSVLQGKLAVPCKIDKQIVHVQYSSGAYDGCGHVVRTIIQLSVHMKSPLASDVTFCNNSSDFIPNWYLIWNWIQLSEDLQIKKHTDKNTVNTEHWRAV